MIVVIIAGGSGTRLWPLSTPDYPKHLLSLTDQNSLLQNTYSRVSQLTEPEQIFVVSEASHVNHVIEQLSEMPQGNILVEPARRGTASCILLALNEISRRGLKDQGILFIWADHVIRDTRGFIGTATQAATLAEKLQKMVFIGVEPTFASSGLGYMEKGERLENGFKNAFELKKFVEKPDHQTATQYFQSGNYLWNTGYLVATRSTLEREIKTHAPGLWQDYQTLLKTADIKQIYLGFEPRVLEYALSEKVTDGLVVPGTFDWLDIGSFKDLHGASHHDSNGNHLNGENIVTAAVNDSYIRNELDLPVAVIGLDNVAVITTENGILVANKSYSQKIGEVSKQINEEENK
jgi:mannose-1-phosphate guanylyltransferase